MSSPLSGRRAGRVSGRAIALTLLALALAVSGVGIWILFHSHPEPGDLIEVVALDGDYALVVRDVDGERERDRDFFSLYHIREGERWGGLVPSYPHEPGRVGIAATPNVATIRVVADGASQVLGFTMHGQLKTGRLELSSGGPDVDPVHGATLSDVATVADLDGSVEILGADDRWAELVATDIDRGTLDWRVRLEGPIEPVWLRAGQLVTTGRQDIKVIDRRDGALHPVATHGGGPTAPPVCVLDDTAIIEVADPAGPSLVLVPLAAPDRGAARFVIADLLGAEPSPSDGFAGHCGRRGGTILIALESRDHAFVVAVDAATGIVAWRADLGAGTFDVVGMRTLRRRSPDADPFSGALADVVPILVGEVGTRNARMVALDTATGALAGAAPVSADLGGARLMRDGDRSYLFAPSSRLLASFDRSGTIGGVVSVAGFGDVWPAQLAEQHVWLFDARRLVVLDGVNLAITAASTDPAPVLADSGEAAIRLGFAVPVL